MVQPKCSRPRWGHGTPLGLSRAKSEETVKAGTTQHRPAQAEQSARRSDRSVTAASCLDRDALLDQGVDVLDAPGGQRLAGVGARLGPRGQVQPGRRTGEAWGGCRLTDALVL